MYGAHEALIEIATLRIIRGSLPPRASGLVVEWGLANRPALQRAWQQAASSQRIDRIEPLRHNQVMEGVVPVRPLPGYRLWVRCSGGLAGGADLSALVGRGVFAACNDPAEFAKVSIDERSRTVCWPSGIDLDPDVLSTKVSGRALPDVDVAA